MDKYTKLALTLLLLLSMCIGVCITATADEAWSVSKVSLVPTDEHTARLQATVTGSPGRESFTLADQVTLTKIAKYFVFRDRLVVLGEAGRAQAVVLYDLLKREKIDWFYCYYPDRLSDSLLVYVEWFPNMVAGGEPFDVVLLYDLEKSPTENRIDKNSKAAPIPAPNRSAPVRVGLPIYPPSNAQTKSYENVTSRLGITSGALANTFALLSPRHLIFVGVDEGKDAGDMRDYLVVVDFSEGIEKLKYQTVDIPKNELKIPGPSNSFVVVNSVESLGNGMVRLHVPESDYGVPSIVVQIPKV
jgi:hypothetical protein